MYQACGFTPSDCVRVRVRVRVRHHRVRGVRTISTVRQTSTEPGMLTKSDETVESIISVRLVREELFQEQAVFIYEQIHRAMRWYQEHDHYGPTVVIQVEPTRLARVRHGRKLV